jgi:hypothetical protein
MENVQNSIICNKIREKYPGQLVESNSVGLLIAVDDEKEREAAIHFILKVYHENKNDGPIAISFDAQTTLDNFGGNLVISPLNWHKCDVTNPPSSFILNDCDTSVTSKTSDLENQGVLSSIQCTASTKKNKRCLRKTFHSSSVCWQHRV